MPVIWLISAIPREPSLLMVLAVFHSSLVHARVFPANFGIAYRLACAFQKPAFIRKSNRSSFIRASQSVSPTDSSGFLYRETLPRSEFFGSLLLVIIWCPLLANLIIDIRLMFALGPKFDYQNGITCQKCTCFRLCNKLQPVRKIGLITVWG